jgi:DNA-directed RNA polymerase specialized sigma24 family protein
MATTDEITNALEKNKKERRALEAKLKRLREDAYAIVVAGDLAGVPKLTLAESAGLTRQTVYTVLLRAKAGV